MTRPKFYVQLLGCTVLAALVVVGFHQEETFARHGLLSWGGCILFTILNVGFFEVGRRAQALDNPSYFSGFYMLSIGLKLLLSLSAVAVYYHRYMPEQKIFVFPFLATYLIYTSFEVYFLTRLAQNNNPR